MTSGDSRRSTFRGRFMKRLAFSAAWVALMACEAWAVDISTYSSAGCAFPDTNQSVDYTATFGEDHDYASSVSSMSFTVYNPVGVSSVTVDNRTGLMWITTPQTDAGFNKPGASIWEVAISSCEALSYAGYTDWRLPNVRELMSIADYQSGTNIDARAFPYAIGGNYWTSTTQVGTSSALYVAFGIGIGDLSKTLSYYVRCVRGGP